MGQSYPQCGDITTWSVRCEKGASEGHTNRAIPHDCHRLSCPVCFDAEVWRRAREAADRMNSVRKAYYLNGVESDYVEVIIYPPKEKRDHYFGTAEGYEEMSAAILQINDDYGILGGVKFVHTTAVNRDEGASYKEYEKYRQGDKTARVRYNPHIQQVCLRRQDWNVRKDRSARWRASGWFVRVLYADGRYGERRWNSVARKINYELSHADQGVTDAGHKKAFTTWFGIMAYNNVAREDEIEKHEEKCSCGAQCWLYFEDERRELAYTKTVIHHYHLRIGALERALRRYGIMPGPIRSETLSEFGIA